MIKLRLPEKSQKFRLKFYRWYIKIILDRNFGRLPTESEIDSEIANQRTVKYGDANALHCLEVIQIYSETYSREVQFPMKCKECLRRVIGRRSYGENLPIFKRFFQHYLKSSAVKSGEPTHQQTDEYNEQRTVDFIKWFNREGVDAGFYQLFVAEIPKWRKEHRVKPQKSAAAKSRWLKENRKKILTLLIKRINAISHL